MFESENVHKREEAGEVSHSESTKQLLFFLIHENPRKHIQILINQFVFSWSFPELNRKNSILQRSTVNVPFR